MSKKFTFWRNAVISETYEITADNEEAAREVLENGGADPIFTEFIDWSTDQFQLDSVEDICPLHQMIVQYDQQQKETT